jgi:hypothetical protein
MFPQTKKKQLEFAEASATPAKPNIFCNSSQDGHNYTNSANVDGILGAPNQAGTSGAAISVLPSRSAYAYSAINAYLADMADTIGRRTLVDHHTYRPKV